MTNNKYPRTLSGDGERLVIRMMSAADRAAILAFARNLAEEDLFVLRDDVTRAENVDRWIDDLTKERAISLLLEDKGKLVGYGTLEYNQLSWTRHMAELHILVSSPYRNRGYGKQLTRELLLFAQDMSLEKVVVYILAAQQGAQRMFESLRFKPEALLTDWVKTRNEQTQDLLILSRLLVD